MKNKIRENQDKAKNYLRFSSVAIQMGIIITAGALSGNWLDEKQENEFPVWTLCLSLFTIFTSIYLVIKEVIRMGKNNEKNKNP